MSDYISREEVFKLPRNTTRSLSGKVIEEDIDIELIKAIPSADVIEIPKGVTNEDVLNDTLRRVFPRVIFIRRIDELNKTQGIHMSEEWLRQPYKGADMRGKSE